jgi:polysaccharide pyruvyl transferase WcaK-like protein
MKNSVILLDPSIDDGRGTPSRNLGDLIIYQAVSRELAAIFGEKAITRLSTHHPFSADDYETANRCAFRFVGGSNLLSSKKTKYTWYREEHRWNWLFPKLRRVTLFGVGWGVGYPAWRGWRPKCFYRRALDRRHLHSVRDSFSEGMLRGIGIRNVLNTSCPTLWTLNGFDSNAPRVSRDCIFTLTDYRCGPERDNLIVETLHRLFPGTLYFFPQGANDIEYLESLAAFTCCRDRIQFLARDVACLGLFLDQHADDVLYVGTRLHGGALAMQHGIKALIIAVDHRAAEIAKDTSLPVLETDIAAGIERWLAGALVFDPIRLPMENIQRWRDDWRGVAAEN